MPDYMYNPEELSAALDEMLAGAGTPNDDVLLQTALRVLEAPTPVLPPAVSARIEAQVLNKFRTLPSRRASFPRVLLILGGIILAVLIAGVILVSLQWSTSLVSATETGTPLQTSTHSSMPPTTPIPTGISPIQGITLPTMTMDHAVTTESPIIIGSSVPSRSTLTLSPSLTPTTVQTTAAIVTITNRQTSPYPVVSTVITLTSVVPSATLSGTNTSTSLPTSTATFADLPTSTPTYVPTATTVPSPVPLPSPTPVVVSTPESAVSGTGDVWIDNGNCDNPPPTWAPAIGWRRRCEGQVGNPGNGNGN